MTSPSHRCGHTARHVSPQTHAPLRDQELVCTRNVEQKRCGTHCEARKFQRDTLQVHLRSEVSVTHFFFFRSQTRFSNHLSFCTCAAPLRGRKSVHRVSRLLDCRTSCRCKLLRRLSRARLAAPGAAVLSRGSAATGRSTVATVPALHERIAQAPCDSTWFRQSFLDFGRLQQ